MLKVTKSDVHTDAKVPIKKKLGRLSKKEMSPFFPSFQLIYCTRLHSTFYRESEKYVCE